MLPIEPIPTAILLLTIGALMAVSVLLSGASGRFGVPVVLLFLVIGMLAGEEGLGGLAFDDYALTFRLGTIALALILFDGGLNTPLGSVRKAIGAASVLATFGVLITAGVLATGAHLLGLSWPEALLLSAVVSSTDAAAVFSVLRGAGINLKRRVGGTLELESGLNDPMAIILTVALTAAVVNNEQPDAWLAYEVLKQLAIGGVLGVAIGYGARMLLGRTHLPAGGLYPVLTLAVAFLSFSVPTLVGGSGFLAVYATAVVLGNGAMPYRSGIIRVHDSIAWLCQIAMFLMLGLLVFPGRLMNVAWIGLALAFVLTFVARPLAVFLCLLPFRYTARDMSYIGWVGLRGAVPIILAVYPVLAGAEGALRIFDIVFFIVVVNTIIPGGTVGWVTRKLGLESSDPPSPPAALEISSTQLLRGEILSFYIDPAVAVCGIEVQEIPFPEGSSALLIMRGAELIAPRGGTVLQPGDHVYLFAEPDDVGMLQLMFGRPQGD